MYFFGNTKLFCHFLLADIEKVLYIYMPFYDGMATFKGGNCSTKEDVPWCRLCVHGRHVEPQTLERQQTLVGTYFLGKWCTSVEKTIKNTGVLLVSNLIFIYLQLLS